MNKRLYRTMGLKIREVTKFFNMDGLGRVVSFCLGETGTPAGKVMSGEGPQHLGDREAGLFASPESGGTEY